MVTEVASSSAPPYTSVTARDLAFIFFRRLRGMAIIFLCVVSAALVYQLLIKQDVYVVTAKLLVKIGYEQSGGPSASTGDKLSIVGYRHQDIRSEVEILKNTEFLQTVVERLHLDVQEEKPRPTEFFPLVRYVLKQRVEAWKDWVNEWMIKIGFRSRLSPREAVVAALEEGLLVEPEGDSNVVTAKLALPVREGSSKVLELLLNIYLESRLTMFQDAGIVDLFAAQRDQALTELQAAEADLARLEAESDVVSMESQKTITLDQIALAQGELTKRQEDHAAIRQDLERLRHSGSAGMPGVLGTVERNTYQSSLLRSMASLEQERIALSVTDTDTAPTMTSNRRKFDTLRTALTDNLANEERELQARISAQQASLSGLVTRVRELHEREAQWKTAKRRLGNLEERYQLYQKKLEEARANAVLEQQRIGNVSVIQHPVDPFRPAGLRKSVFLLIATILGVFIAVSWASVAEFFDHRVYTPDHARHLLGAGVIATVPEVGSRVAASLLSGRAD